MKIRLPQSVLEKTEVLSTENNLAGVPCAILKFVDLNEQERAELTRRLGGLVIGTDTIRIPIKELEDQRNELVERNLKYNEYVFIV